MTEAAEPRPEGAWRRTLTAAALYFCGVFAVGLVFGPVRVLWLEPWLGQTLAILCEAPFLIAAMVIAGWTAPRLAGLERGWMARLLMGMIALAMQQVADLSVGFGLRGINLEAQLAYFQTPPGYVYIVMLVLFALMPLIVYWRTARAPA